MTLAELLPWAIAAAALLALLASLLTSLLRPSGTAETRRQAEAVRAALAETERALRRDLTEGTRANLTEAFDSVMRGNAAMQSVIGGFRTHVTDTLDRAGIENRDALDRFARAQDSFADRLREEQERLRLIVGEKLDEMRAGNEAKLEAMRAAVDERLQSALEKQIGESFRQVTEQFAQVQQAIGQVQQVAGQVGDLQRLFSNVRARGGWGEAQLGLMLEDTLPAGSFVRGFRPREGTGEIVEFALRLPSKESVRWVPVDAKFPAEDYDRMLLAAEAGDRAAEDLARAGLARRVRDEAARIAGKYIQPPLTAEFALLYLPTDGLFVEVARIPGLIERARVDHRVMIMGPSLLPAFLHTLAVGHHAMTLEAKAVEIGRTLQAVRTEWEKFRASLDALAKRAANLTSGIEDTQKRGRAVERKLRGLQTLDHDEAQALLGLDTPSGPTAPPADDED